MTEQYNNIAENGGGTYVPPDYTPAPIETNAIADMTGAVTPWRSVNLAAKASGPSTFDGTYPIIAVTAKEIVLGDPGDINAEWNAIGSDETIYFSPGLSTDGTFWIGPFVIDMPDCEEVVANFICPQGLFRFNKEGEPRSQSVSGLLEVTPVDAEGTPTEAPTTHTITLRNTPEN